MIVQYTCICLLGRKQIRDNMGVIIELPVSGGARWVRCTHDLYLLEGARLGTAQVRTSEVEALDDTLPSIGI